MTNDPMMKKILLLALLHLTAIPVRIGTGAEGGKSEVLRLPVGVQIGQTVIELQQQRPAIIKPDAKRPRGKNQKSEIVYESIGSGSRSRVIVYYLIDNVLCGVFLSDTSGKQGGEFDATHANLVADCKNLRVDIRTIFNGLTNVTVSIERCDQQNEVTALFLFPEMSGKTTTRLWIVDNHKLTIDDLLPVVKPRGSR